MAAGHEQKFFEVIKPGTDIDFIGTRRIWMGISLLAVLVTIAMLPLNAFVIPGRGQALNWSVEFKGGSEIETHFSKKVEPGDIRGALEKAGYHGVEVFRSFSATGQEINDFTIRMGAVTPLPPDQAKKAEEVLRAKKIDGGSLRSFELSEGGDKLYLRLDKAVDPVVLTADLKAAGVNPTQVQAFGRAEDHNYEATLVGLESEVKKALEAKLGPDTVTIKQASSVGAKAGAQLVNDGIKAMLGSILLIVVYVAFRFDFRYGPGTIVALLHDAILVIGAFAITYKEFSLTTLAAILTIIGFSMNDTIVVFDRIRENVAKHRDRRFDKVVNLSVNETLSRTILTSATVFFVTLAMNIFGTGAIRDFAFAMNVGVIVGTYSSVFIAAPVLIWLNDKYVAAQKKQAGRADRQGRRPVRRPKDEDGDSAEV
jgi:preprotein translocase subunit SecF